MRFRFTVLALFSLLVVVAGCTQGTTGAGDAGPVVTAQPDAAIAPRNEGSACDPARALCRIPMICVVTQDSADGGGTCRYRCATGEACTTSNRICSPLSDRDSGVCIPPRG